MANISDPDLPDFHQSDLVVYLPRLNLMIDLLAGTERMHEKNTTYIRKWKDEDPKVFNIRSRLEQLFEGLGRTLSAAVGMIFAREPKIEWNQGEAEISEHWKNIDGAGTVGHVFIKQFTEQSIRDGVGLILVDHPPVPKDPETDEPLAITAANEKIFGLRPKWAAYPRTNILSWRTIVDEDQEQSISQVVLWEPRDEPNGLFGTKTVNYYRLLGLDPGGRAFFILLRQTSEDAKSTEDFEVKDSGFFLNKNGQTTSKIPVSVAHTGKREKMLVATIPLLGVAYANLGHYQLSTNRRFYLEVASFPQPTIVGDLAKTLNSQGIPIPSELKLGPLVTVHLEGEGASFTYTSPDMDAFVPLNQAVEEKDRHMAVLGMSFLAKDSRSPETAEAKRLDATAENATLATAAQGIDDAVNQAFVHHAWFMGIEETQAPIFALNRDFEATALDPQTMAVYVNAVANAGLPPRLLLEAWQQGGRISPDTDLAELELEMMALIAASNQDAIEDEEDQLLLEEAS